MAKNAIINSHKKGRINSVILCFFLLEVFIMDIYDVFEVLEQLGVACDVNGSKVNFFDKENGLEMEIWEDKTKELLIDDLEMYRYYTLYSPKKMVRFQLKHPRIYGELDEKQIVLERTCFSDGHENHVVDLDSGINKAFKIQSYYEDDGIVTGRSEIIVDGSNRIYFDLFGKNPVDKPPALWYKNEARSGEPRSPAP